MNIQVKIVKTFPQTEKLKAIINLTIACYKNFEQIYGERGKDFIEVHHIKPLYTVKECHEVSAEDLRPLCSNCHSMIHRKRDEELTIEQLR